MPSDLVFFFGLEEFCLMMIRQTMSVWVTTTDEPVYTCVCEEGVDGKSVDSEATSLLSYTLRYVSLTDLVRLCQFGL